ncbi:MAG: hypothetical protein K8F52_16020 [Candidatus Scalindua rubra]|uniref:Uncharacterized protein n=1 Tax=Candidatus Scalindua brodae TaxID=237368 RepID=A0A0B0EPG9_9BACT|nr:MAG: hypothetical protein SCABRO_01741 [Candidatus Scalindua brodae]MBZ0110157.1 hypothetical protein [Candidatus Scalindua rubra]
MVKERAYYDCGNYNTSNICKLLANLKRVLNGTETLTVKEDAANKFCSTCNTFINIIERYKPSSSQRTPA